MDEHNQQDLEEEARRVKNPKAKIMLLGEMCPEDDVTIRDPYYVSFHCSNNCLMIILKYKLRPCVSAGQWIKRV